MPCSTIAEFSKDPAYPACASTPVAFLEYGAQSHVANAADDLHMMYCINQRAFSCCNQCGDALQVPPRRLTSLNKCMRGARVGNFELVQEQLHLGDAMGNRFEITLRCATRAAALQPIPSHHCSCAACNGLSAIMHACFAM